MSCIAQSNHGMKGQTKKTARPFSLAPYCKRAHKRQKVCKGIRHFMFCEAVLEVRQ